MCSNPITANDITFACRKCNDCLNTRKNGWVARAMAERSTSATTYSITLTYADETLPQRDGAQIFRYSDVSALLNRIRAAGRRDYGDEFYARFIVAGEFGSERNRCHWHLILFSNFDCIALGNFKNFHTKKTVTKKEDIISADKRVKRLTWSLWGQGLVTFQEPDQGGMAYALKYVLKDQFNIKNSVGTMREHKADRYGSGYFRMSKKPPIGGLFVHGLLNSWRERRICPVTLKLKIPDYTGYWYPSGTLRRDILLSIYTTNQLRIVETGQPCPQFNTLLRTMQPDSKDWEILVYGTDKKEEEFLTEDFAREINLRTREIEEQQRVTETRRKCGGYVPCAKCLASTTPEAFAAIKADLTKQIETYGNFDNLEKHHKKTNRPSPHCQQPDRHKRVFKDVT